MRVCNKCKKYVEVLHVYESEDGTWETKVCDDCISAYIDYEMQEFALDEAIGS